MNPTTAFPGVRTFEHEGHHGFCTVCGSVWPCARARRQSLARHLDAA